MSNLESPTILSNTPPDSSYEKALKKKEFFNTVSEKYSEHARKLVSLKYFRHMRNELKRFNELFNEILETIDNKDFNITYYETKFNKLIEEDNETMDSL